MKPQLLVSSLDSKRFSARELPELDHERWQIELGLDATVKTEMLDSQQAIRSKTPEAVAQELWGQVDHNLVRREMAALADEVRLLALRISPSSHRRRNWVLPHHPMA